VVREQAPPERVVVGPVAGEHHRAAGQLGRVGVLDRLVRPRHAGGGEHPRHQGCIRVGQLLEAAEGVVHAVDLVAGVGIRVAESVQAHRRPGDKPGVVQGAAHSRRLGEGRAGG
jgi:hypothetical protein